nr:RagB/SusD family nutrient uptake outer membrane protein [Parabacteroides goldsteinii]
MKRNILLSSLLLSILFFSCTNLESEMYDTINPGIFPKNQKDAEALVTSAAYSPFRSAGYSGIFQVAASGVQIIGDMTTDLGECQWSDSWWPDMLNFNFTTSSQRIGTLYDYMKDISKMTLTIERIKDVPMPEDVKERLIAELHCGKGWLGYLLYDWFGPIQVATLEQLQNPLVDEIVPRLSQEDMVSFIETELLESIKALPANYTASNPDYGRFTRGLAYTVLMKLYMHEKDWEKAESCGRELMKSEYAYQLVPEYADIFTLENEKNSEIIWACQSDRSGNMSLWQAHVLPSVYPTKNTSIQKWGGYRVPWQFYNTFDKEDKRLKVLVGEFTGTDGVVYNEKNQSNVLNKGALPVKYGEDPAAVGEASQVDWIVYRYADILTALSEVIVRKNNAVTQEAVDLLNTIRSRAGVKPYTMSDISGVQDFLDKVLLNRGQEFWFEGVRRTDLIRHGKYIEFAKKYKNSTSAADHMVLMPIPQNVINQGKGKVLQNPGY